MHQHFPTLDALNTKIQLISAGSSSARLTQIGASRLGDPMIMLSIGGGDRHALILGGPHANEPVGFLTVLELARRLTDSPELAGGYTWHLVPCIDPDAARLNESWYTTELATRSYYRHFYRPSLAEQPEWTFPADSDHSGPVFPETRAVMRIIGELRPRFLCSLHNSDTGGAFFVLNRPAPDLAATLSAIPARHGLPMASQPVDCIGWPRVIPGVWVLPAVEFGTSSAHYAARHGTLSIWPEVPMWRACGTLMSTADELASAMDLLDDSLKRLAARLVVQTPFRAAVLDTIRGGRGLGRAFRSATGEARDELMSVARLLPLRGLGMLLRLLDAEYAAGNHRPLIRAEQARLGTHFAEWCAGLDAAALTPVPVGDLVAVQVETALAAAAYCVT